MVTDADSSDDRAETSDARWSSGSRIPASVWPRLSLELQERIRLIVVFGEQEIHASGRHIQKDRVTVSCAYRRATIRAIR